MKDKNTKLGILTHNIDKGGVQRIAISEAKALQNRGYDTTLYSIVTPTDPWDELLDGVEIEYSIGSPGSLVVEGVSRGIGSFIRPEMSSDLNICHNLPGLVLGYRMWKRDGTPYIAYVHDSSIYPIAGSPLQYLFSTSGTDPIRRWVGHYMSEFEYNMLDCAETIFVNSKATKKDIESKYGFETNYLYPTMISQVESKPVPREDFFLVVQRLGAHSTYDLLYDILEQVPELEVVITGKKKSEVLFGRLSDKFESFGSRVTFAPNPSEQELEDLYNRARGYLQPGHENFNMSALEAAKVGCPIVVTEQSGIAELFTEYPLLCDGADSSEFVEVIRSLLADNEFTEEMGRSARSIAGQWDEEYHVNKLLSAIRDTAQPHSHQNYSDQNSMDKS